MIGEWSFLVGASSSNEPQYRRSESGAVNASTDATSRWFVHRAIADTRLIVPFFHVFRRYLMKRNVFQLVLGLAAMTVVLVGLESQAQAFGHGSCGSHGGFFSHRSHCCQQSYCCEAKQECGCEQKEASCGCEQSSCESSCCGRRHHRNRGCGCNSGCESGCGGGCGGGCGCGQANSDEGTSAPPPPEEKHEKHQKNEKHKEKSA